MRYRDADLIQTKDKLIFRVIGYSHPPARVISYLRYILDRGAKKVYDCRRISKRKVLYLLRKQYPHYLFHSKLWGIEISAVPIRYLYKHYCPVDRLREICTSKEIDPLERSVLEFVSILSRESRISNECFGVTGSLLIRAHEPSTSDIDLVIYGRKNSQVIKEALISLYNNKATSIRRLYGKQLKAWYGEVLQRCHLSIEDLKTIHLKKWNIGLFKDRKFSIHSVKLDEEIVERYEDKKFVPSGYATIKAVISDACDAFFYPSKYKVEKVEVLEGKSLNILEIESYDGLYTGLFNVGEKVIAKGKVEKVVDRKSGEEYYRLLIGSLEMEGKDFIKLVKK
jgi:hypothetical protein